jgi:hypothetical protein
MGFDKPGGGGGGGGGGMTLLDQGTVSLASSGNTYVGTGISEPTRNLWCNVTHDVDPFDNQQMEQTRNPTAASSVGAAVGWSDSQQQWNVIITTGSSADGDYRWFLYELPTG